MQIEVEGCGNRVAGRDYTGQVNINIGSIRFEPDSGPGVELHQLAVTIERLILAIDALTSRLDG